MFPNNLLNPQNKNCERRKQTKVETKYPKFCQLCSHINYFAPAPSSFASRQTQGGARQGIRQAKTSKNKQDNDNNNNNNNNNNNSNSNSNSNNNNNNNNNDDDDDDGDDDDDDDDDDDPLPGDPVGSPSHRPRTSIH